MKKRILSLGIACCLVFNVLLGTVRAEGEEPFVQEETEAESVEPEVSEEEVSEEEQSEQTESKEKSDVAETPEEIVISEETDSENPDAVLEEPGEAADGEATVEGETEDTITPEEASVTEDPTASEQTVPEAEDVETAEAEEETISTFAAEPVNEIAVLAAEGEADVTSVKELEAALKNDAIDTINIAGSFTYSGTIEAKKTIVIKSGVTFTWRVSYSYTFRADLLKIEKNGKFSISKNSFMAQAIVEGKVTNNGTIEVTGSNSGDCLWTASTDGDGTFSVIEGTYISYGTVPDKMLAEQKNYKINVVKDLSIEPTVSLPEPMTVGDTIKVTVTNLIEGVNLGDAFTFKWTNGSSFERYKGAAEPTLSEPGTLNLRLSAKKPYAIRIKGNRQPGDFDVSGTVMKQEYALLYVDQLNGDDTNLGTTKDTPLKNLYTAAGNIQVDGTIILLSNYNGRASFTKSVTIKSADGNTYKLGQSTTNYSSINENNDVIVTLNNVELNGFALRDYSLSHNGKLIITDCTGNIRDAGYDVGSGGTPVKNVEISNSNMTDSIENVENLTLTDTTVNNRFYGITNLTLKGKNTVIQGSSNNSPSRVEGTIDGDGILRFSPESPKKGLKLIQVPDETQDKMISRMELADTKDGQYRLKGYKDGGTYIGIAERVIAQGKLGVGNEPVLQAEVDRDGHIWIENDNSYSYQSVIWSGYTDTANNVWSADDMPELKVTLRLLNDKNSSFFDNQFNPEDMTVYSWKDVTDWPELTDENLNTSVQIVVKEGQGASEDGDSFTFTIAYPKVERLEQTITTDCSDRAAYCNDILEAREAKAETTISYASSDPEIASVDAATGVITAHKPGTVQILIKAEETEFYKETQVSYKLTVSHHPVTAPEAVGDLTYNGKVQTLVTQQPTVEGTMMYKVNDGEWQTELPTASVAGTYTISYKAYMGEEHGETEAQELEVTILPKKATVTPDSTYKIHNAEDPELTWTAEGLVPGDSLKEIAVKRSAGDEVGIYEITAEQKENANPNYDLTFEKGVFTVIPAAADETLELGKGSVSLKTEAGEGIGSITADVSETELLKMLMKNGTITSEELVQLVNGASMELVFTVKEITSSISESSKAQFQKAAGDYTIGQYLDISIYKYLIVNGSRGEAQPVHETGEKIALAIQVSESLAVANKNTDRTYRLLRNHEGTVEIINGNYLADTNTYKFESDKFSDYAIAYKDVTKTTAKTSKKKHHKSGSTANDTETVAAGTTATAGTVSAAATGDQSQAAGYGVLFLISLTAVTIMLKRRRRF